MSHPQSSPAFFTDYRPPIGQPVQAEKGIVSICAPNSGPYTFTGTNTYLVGETNLLVIDPGPDDVAHGHAILGAIGKREVTAILLTHTHKDHSGLARKLKKATGAPLWFEGRHRLSRSRRTFEVNLIHNSCDWSLVPDRVLKEGDRLQTDLHELEVIETPGHCANHLAFGVRGSRMLFSGDHVMGWSSTLVATPDGSMADHLASLEKLHSLDWTHYFPGHGAPIPHESETRNARNFAAALLGHRRIRNRQILDAVRSGARSVHQIVASIYPQASMAIRVAAGMAVTAHVEYLEELGELSVRRRFLRNPELSVITPEL